MDDLSRRNGALHRIEELDKLLMPVLLHATPQHGAIENIERGEQGGGAIPLIIVGHGCAFAGLQRKAGLRAIERLNLAFLIDGQHHGMTGRLHVQADDILHFRGKGGIVGHLEVRKR